MAKSQWLVVMDKLSSSEFQNITLPSLDASVWFQLWTLLGSMCMFDIFHLTFNFKSKVARDVFKNKNECQLTSTFSSKMSPQCHMPSNTCGFLLHKSHYMSKSKLCMSIDMHFNFVPVFVCQISKTCKNFVKNTRWRPVTYWHHPLACPDVRVWKMVGQHVFLNIVPNNVCFWQSFCKSFKFDMQIFIILCTKTRGICVESWV
jgi:hypothetical protein